MRRIITSGGRDWKDEYIVTWVLHAVSPGGLTEKVQWVNGACPTGGDEIVTRNVATSVEEYPADWTRFGRKAGPIRNEEMARRGADLCVAFWDGESSGTGGMRKLAVAYNIPLLTAYNDYRISTEFRDEPLARFNFFEAGKVSREVTRLIQVAKLYRASLQVT